ncbi:MAG: histidinol-phosphatase HisJ family protein [Oscillospiraceae bacterium]|nr:histidinol-phosphatase HisJ family protein [Oscillospiraceae bacterium]
MFDYHMHSVVSFDGHDAPEDMVRAAVAAGLKEICFTDHIDYFADVEVQEWVFDTKVYNDAYDHLEHPALKIRRGLEFGIKPYNAPQLREDLKRRHFDFVLGSVHFVDEKDVYYQEFWDGLTVPQAERRYLEETLTCVMAHDDFDVLGHLTYISKARANPAPRPVPMEEHRELIDEILRVLAQKGKGMEINTSGVDRCGDFLPYEPYFRRFKELGGQIVTVGSDAHTASRVGQYSHRACELLKDIFGYVCTFENREPVFHKL